jgi:hypothetical protein
MFQANLITTNTLEETGSKIKNNNTNLNTQLDITNIEMIPKLKMQHTQPFQKRRHISTVPLNWQLGKLVEWIPKVHYKYHMSVETHKIIMKTRIGISKSKEWIKTWGCQTSFVLMDQFQLMIITL